MVGERERLIPLARRDAIVLLLAIAGGSVDAVVLLRFDVLAAGQTGNTIILAVSLVSGDYWIWLSSAVSVVGYVIGAALGELVIVGRADSATRRAAVGRTLVAELIPLGCLLIIWNLAGSHPSQAISALLVALASLAMGIQSAAVLRLHAGPTTTYVTGTLTTFTTETIRRLRLTESGAGTVQEQHAPSSAGLFSRGGPWMYGITWIVYAGGAIVSGLLYIEIHELALVLPIVAILAVIVADARGK